MAETEPRIVAETESYLVVFKPAGLHSAPLSEEEDDNVLAWSARFCPAVLAVRGRKNVERGLLHRLDRDTEGLVLLAKTQEAYDRIGESQERGLFLKEYDALCDPRSAAGSSAPFGGRPVPFAIESGFRPYGPGRRAVRAVEVDGEGRPIYGRVKELALDRGKPYRTDVLSIGGGNGRLLVRARLSRGFRHQVRCHLAWIGLPLVGDELYGKGGPEPLGLRAVALAFPDPGGNGTARYDVS